MAKYSTIKIGDWTVEPAINQLRRRDTVVQVGPRAMELLMYLAAHAGQVVSTEALISDVWEGRTVGDGSVYLAINQLRNALGDDRNSPRYVQTVPRRGYRLIAPVTPFGSNPATWGTLHRGAVITAVAAGALLFLSVATFTALRESSEQMPVPPRQTLAVLPFESLSADPEDADFAAGIQNDLLAALSKIGDLRVIARASVLAYPPGNRDLTAIGNALDATAVLEGSVQRSGDTVRINVQLIDIETTEHLWAENYDRELSVENIFGIRSEMAASIASALEATLTESERDRLAAVPTRNSRAYELYLSGVEYFSRLDDRRFTPLAVRQLQSAVDEDPTFAQAWAELARARLRFMYFGLGEREVQLPLAHAAVERALTLAPDAGEPYLALAWYHYMGEQDFPAALEALAVAEERLPGSSEVFLSKAYVHRRAGSWEQELASVEQAIARDPHNINLVHELFSVNRRLRNYERAEIDLKRILELAPDHSRYRRVEALFAMQRDGDFALLKAAAASPLPLRDREVLGWEAALYERNYELALRYLDAWRSATPVLDDRSWERRSMYGITFTLAGRPDLGKPEFRDARAEIEAALETVGEDAELLVDLGEVLAWTGEREAAERLALRAIELAQSGDALHISGIRGNAISRVLGPAGARASIVDELEKYLQRGPWSIEGLLPDPRLDPVRDDLDFHALVARHKRP